jgi:hypothetical protein
MIANILKGGNFCSTLNYAIDREEAKIISQNLVGDRTEDLSKQFNWHCRSNPKVTRRVYHLILAVKPEENIDEPTWKAIAKDYLEGMNLYEVPFVAVRHRDRPHDHIHIITTRIRADGVCVKDGCDYSRSRKVLNEIEEKYNLWRTPPKRLPEPEEEVQKEEVRQKLERMLPVEGMSFERWCEMLSAENIEVKVLKKRKRSYFLYSYGDKTYLDSSMGESLTHKTLCEKMDWEINPEPPQSRNLTETELWLMAQLRGAEQLKLGDYQFGKEDSYYTLTHNGILILKYQHLPGDRALVVSSQQDPQPSLSLDNLKQSRQLSVNQPAHSKPIGR